VTGPDGATVELRLVFEPTGAEPTDSTSIAWDPVFARAFRFVGSEPAPWRFRVDPSGWAVLDTSGVLPGEYGTFRVWFVPATRAHVAPRVRVVADGGEGIADVVVPVHTTSQLGALFERGMLAQDIDRLPPVLSDSRGALPIALGMAIGLTLSIAGGFWSAFLVTRSTRSG
jgi:hypothetical protein